MRMTLENILVYGWLQQVLEDALWLFCRIEVVVYDKLRQSG